MLSGCAKPVKNRVSLVASILAHPLQGLTFGLTGFLLHYLLPILNPFLNFQVDEPATKVRTNFLKLLSTVDNSKKILLTIVIHGLNLKF